MPELISLESLIALVALTALEIVLGIDNVVFIAILTSRLPKASQASARRLGLGLAMLTRIGLLFAISWTMSLVRPVFSLWEHAVSGRDLILLAGGAFLLFKATHELHGQVEGGGSPEKPQKAPGAYWAVVAQIGLLDIIFSLDSVITAVGMARHIAIMITAVVIAVIIMIVFAGSVSAFIERHPTMRVLALSFLILIGVMLVAEGLGQHINRGYIYFAMAFSMGVELINMRVRNKPKTA
ncbi:membrane protein [Desulfocarbo indianensis]|nr:membrane protein [Desulfocarbo indianensis]